MMVGFADPIGGDVRRRFTGAIGVVTKSLIATVERAASAGPLITLGKSS